MPNSWVSDGPLVPRCVLSDMTARLDPGVDGENDSAPFESRLKAPYPLTPAFNVLTTSCMVEPAAGMVTLIGCETFPSALATCRLITPPGVKPLASVAFSPVL